MKAPQLFSILGLLCLITFASAQQCYTQTGTPLGAGFKPCNSSATTNPGACCNTGGGDICTEIGLCLRQNDALGFFYQDGCTDQSNDPSKCPQFCKDVRDGTWLLQGCNDNVGNVSWCCKPPGSTTNCCSNSSAIIPMTQIGRIVLPTKSVTVTAKITSTASGNAASTVTTTTAATSTGNPIPAPAFTNGTQPATCPKDVSAATSAGVGASLGVAFLAALGILFWRERTRPKGFRDTFSEAKRSPDLLLAMSRSDSGRLHTSHSDRRFNAGDISGFGGGSGVVFPSAAHAGFERSMSAGRETPQGSEHSFASRRGINTLRSGVSGRQDVVRENEQSAPSSLGGRGRSASDRSELQENSQSFRNFEPTSGSVPVSNNSSERLDVSSRVEQTSNVSGASSAHQGGLEIYPNPHSMGGPIEGQKFLRPYELQS